MTPQEIYNTLLKQANSAFMVSSLAKENWGLSICATPIQIGKPIILGINWGGGGSKDHFDYSDQNNNMPTKEDFKNELKTDKFLPQSKAYILKYLNLDISLDGFNYSNPFFFRTPNLKYLKEEDYQKSIPIFKTFVSYLQPTWILSLGNTNIKYFKKNLNPNEISIIEIPLNGKRIGKAEVYGYFGTLLSKPFYCLPHPGAHIHKKDRDEIWEKVFSCEC